MKPLKNFILVLVLSVMGAVIGYTLKLPMGILIGSFAVIAIAKISGLNVPPLKKGNKQKVQMVIGGLVGLNLEPDVASLFLKLIIPGLIATAIHLIFAFLIAYVFMKVFKINWLTALCGSIPAGMSEVSNIAEDIIDVDEQVVMLMHLFRLSLLITVLPIVIKILG